ncbi:sensor histidine kinase [Geomesophilobacter sediminis]|uniref:histidine kinase n=1 Tax=Geomesophilobacter sediminis TaxID=2798584 RepID=A0A8J7JD30_9BACT|nr:ATP-binding protein [Geomesophilobacter sediminis]MBJ6725241.1 PAS domain-containing protein [Geomesophilobacter sediminis]
MKTDKDTSPPTEPAELRRLAEERLKAQRSAQATNNVQETQYLVHELQVHQIELEMQNDELRRARDEVETLLEKYTDLYDFAPTGYFTLDAGGFILAANLRGAGLLGIDRAKLLGRDFGLFVDREARPLYQECRNKVLAGQEKVTVEVPLATEGNRPRFVQIEAVADGSGKECRVALVDITERRLAQDLAVQKSRELEEINRSLEERIRQAVDDLRQRDQMLIIQDRLAVMGDMINSIAHQWRQPLNILALLIQQLPIFFKSGGVTAEFLEENVEKGMEVIDHLSRTVEDFRNFFSPDKKKVTFSIGEEIKRTLSLVAGSFQAQKIAIVVDLQGDPQAFGYPNEYAQVLLNILMNARDALVEKNIAVPVISIRAAEAGGTSVVTISDNAGGVPEGILDRLFDPYFTTKGPEKGTGIGLYLSKAIIVKNMGGRLTVCNTGSGAEFRIEV